jgi:hypothetical protein
VDGNGRFPENRYQAVRLCVPAVMDAVDPFGPPRDQPGCWDRSTGSHRRRRRPLLQLQRRRATSKMSVLQRNREVMVPSQPGGFRHGVRESRRCAQATDAQAAALRSLAACTPCGFSLPGSVQLSGRDPSVSPSSRLPFVRGAGTRPISQRQRSRPPHLPRVRRRWPWPCSTQKQNNEREGTSAKIKEVGLMA